MKEKYTNITESEMHFEIGAILFRDNLSCNPNIKKTPESNVNLITEENLWVTGTKTLAIETL